jgi:hypothetical protein
VDDIRVSIGKQATLPTSTQLFALKLIEVMIAAGRSAKTLAQPGF